jgi:hypothetical protein
VLFPNLKVLKSSILEYLSSGPSEGGRGTPCLHQRLHLGDRIRTALESYALTEAVLVGTLWVAIAAHAG